MEPIGVNQKAAQGDLSPRELPKCFLCGRAIREDQPAIRIRGLAVHVRCAAYRRASHRPPFTRHS